MYFYHFESTCNRLGCHYDVTGIPNPYPVKRLFKVIVPLSCETRKYQGPLHRETQGTRNNGLLLVPRQLRENNKGLSENNKMTV